MISRSILTDHDEDRGETAGLLGGGGLAAHGGEAVGLHPVVDQHVEGGEEHEGDDASEEEPDVKRTVNVSNQYNPSVIL